MLSTGAKRLVVSLDRLRDDSPAETAKYAILFISQEPAAISFLLVEGLFFFSL